MLYAENKCFPSTLIQDMKVFVDARSDFSAQEKKLAMQFGAFMRNEANDRGIGALAARLDFNQRDILVENAAYIKSTLNLSNLEFYNIEDDAANLPNSKDKKKWEAAVPGKPVTLIA